MAATVSDRVMAQQPLHPFFTGRHLVVPSRREEETELALETETRDFSEPNDEQGSATDIEEDPNTERRKRRRTESPKIPKEEESYSASADSASLNPQTQLERGRSGRAFGDDTHLATAPEQRNDTENAHADGGSESNGLAKPRTPSKSRILRLRADGKLRSPSSTENAEEPKVRRKRRSGGKKGKHLILKYGRMPHDRLILGRKIEQIMSGKLRVAPDAEEKRQTGLTSVQPSSESGQGKTAGGQAKSTHPFFVSKAQRQLLKKARDSTPERSAEQSGSESKGPSEVSKPLKAGWPASFGASFSKPARSPGSIEALWPPAGMQHVRGSQNVQAVDISRSDSTKLTSGKLKGKELFISADEEVYRSQRDLVKLLKHRAIPEDDFFTPNADVFVPKRFLLTGRELQERVKGQLESHLQGTLVENRDSVLEKTSKVVFCSPAAQSLFDKIAYSFSAFDTFDYDTQDWCHKYAPKRASDVLQDQKELSLLRDWLSSLNLDNVHTGVSGKSEKLDPKKQLAAKRRKRKIKEELDFFIVSSDDEVADPDEISEMDVDVPSSLPGETNQIGSTLKKLKTSNISKTRAVLLSGPHGCGKSASIYAIAAELGFEVFEINSGTRRNGRDIVDRVGDMTRNHLVRNDARPGSEPQELDQPIIEEVTDEKQKSMTSFFKSNATGAGQKNKKTGPKKPIQPGQGSKPRKQQKQSLILLEEVDVLFEEDKPFWSAVFLLIVQSRRPVVMTCTDERSLPLEDFVDTSAMRLVSQPSAAVSEYLMCLAANEGHLLSRAAVDSLVLARGNDLRGALTELQFWCQMAVGDEKQGITWFMEATAANKKRESSEKLRIVSEATYRADSFLFERKQDRIRDLSYGARLLTEAYEFNGLDPVDNVDFCLDLERGESSQNDKLRDLRAMETCFDALSAADTWIASPSWVEPQDPSQPELSQASRSNYVADFPLLQTDQFEEPSGAGASIAFAFRAAVQRNFPSAVEPESRIKRKKMVNMALLRQKEKPATASQAVAQNRQAFDSLSEPQDGTPWNPSRGSGISVLHGPYGIIAAEVAPIVRGIALYDLDLEEERKKLSELMDVPGRKGKRQRTTRASRAALEGGSKANTRRERWWQGDIDYRSILKTAGSNWTRLAMHGLEAQEQQEPTNENHDGLTPAASPLSSAEPGVQGLNDELE